MAAKMETCVFCRFFTWTRGHHIIPKSKGGDIIVPSCQTCEDFIHKTWSNNELRDIYNTVESILETEQFQNFLKWRRKQTSDTLFKSSPGKFRSKRKYS